MDTVYSATLWILARSAGTPKLDKLGPVNRSYLSCLSPCLRLDIRAGKLNACTVVVKEALACQYRSSGDRCNRGREVSLGRG